MDDGMAKGELIVYQSDDGKVRLDVRLQDETVWLTQPAHGRTVSNNPAKHQPAYP